MPPINNGLDLGRQRSEESSDDWVFGAVSQPSLVSIPEAEREAWLPQGELQFSKLSDFMDCASRSPVNHFEGLFTYHYTHDMKPENKKWLEDSGYVKDNKVTFSDRFVAINSNTTKQGNSLKSPVEAIRKQGLIPKKLLPREDSMDFEAYHDKTKITQHMRTLGTDFIRRFEINYELVAQSHFPEVLKDDMVGVAGFAWPPKVNGVYPRSEEQFNHAFLLYKLPKFQAFDNYIEDNNPADFTKNLTPDYKFYEWGYRMYIAKENVINNSSEIGLWQQLVVALTQLRDWLIANPPTPTPPVPTPTPLPPIPANNLLNVMCLAIQKHEGWFPGSRSQKNNNPGNCKFSTIGYLPIYEPVKKEPNGPFAIFKDYKTGFLYLKNLVLHKARKNPDRNLYAFFSEYAPNEDDNDSRHYAEVVAKAMNVSPSTWKIRNLLEAQSILKGRVDEL